MITDWDIYWMTRLDGITSLLNIVFIGTIICSVYIIIFGPMVLDLVFDISPRDMAKYFSKYVKIVIAILATSGILLTFVPSTKEFAAIYLIPKIVNNEQVQKVPENLVKLLNVKLEQWMDEKLKTKKEK